MEKEKVSIFWFRRDLRIEDNRGLYEALNSGLAVIPIFIFDNEIIEELDKDDSRITFIYKQLQNVSQKLNENFNTIKILTGNPINIWHKLIKEYDIQSVYANEDYEPYAIKRDKNIKDILTVNNAQFKLFKDQVIFAKDEVLKADNTPYTVFTPYKNKWLSLFSNDMLRDYSIINYSGFLNNEFPFPSLSEIGFEQSYIEVLDYNLGNLDNYELERNFPAINQTSHLSPHLRFGTISIRRIIEKIIDNKVFLSELIWREFFMQILYNFPKVVESNFRPKYDSIKWRNNVSEFEKWKKGETGYPMVDAGMRELNATGYMHNRVRMVVAGFLCKHLLIDWKWGEAYFATKLLDYELSANNGNWQWAAGTGCDAAPYFRVFNPTEQIKKFDSKLIYIKKWIPELNSLSYPTPIVEHKMARQRALDEYKKGIQLYTDFK